MGKQDSQRGGLARGKIISTTSKQKNIEYQYPQPNWECLMGVYRCAGPGCQPNVIKAHNPSAKTPLTNLPPHLHFAADSESQNIPCPRWGPWAKLVPRAITTATAVQQYLSRPTQPRTEQFAPQPMDVDSPHNRFLTSCQVQWLYEARYLAVPDTPCACFWALKSEDAPVTHPRWHR